MQMNQSIDVIIGSSLFVAVDRKRKVGGRFLTLPTGKFLDKLDDFRDDRGHQPSTFVVGFPAQGDREPPFQSCVQMAEQHGLDSGLIHQDGSKTESTETQCPTASIISTRSGRTASIMDVSYSQACVGPDVFISGKRISFSAIAQYPPLAIQKSW